MPTSRTISIAVAVAIVLLGAIAYLAFFRPDTTPAVSATGAPTSGAQADFIDLSAQLTPISFDTSIFSDPRFMALQDIHTSIVSEAAGRKDPFAPLTGSVSR